MSQPGNFFGGFLLGTVVGGVVGGVIGTLATARLAQSDPQKLDGSKPEIKSAKKRPLRTPSSEQSMEGARRGLEDKIAQLNEAIDDVRQQLGAVNGTAKEGDRERSITPEP